MIDGVKTKLNIKPVFHEIVYDGIIQHIFTPTDNDLLVDVSFGMSNQLIHNGYMYLELDEYELDFSTLKLHGTLTTEVGFTAGSLNLWSKSLREYYSILKSSP